MKNFKTKILMTTIIAGLAFSVNSEAISQDQEIISKTVTNTVKTYEKKLDPMTFDEDKNLILTTEEIGKGLFYTYDIDGNEVIDNIEYDNNIIATMTPVKFEKYTFKDNDGDGDIESSNYSYEEFMDYSRLAKFDIDKDGLTAEEFIGASFLEVDDDNNGVISLEEWKEEYTPRKTALNNERERYND